MRGLYQLCLRFGWGHPGIGRSEPPADRFAARLVAAVWVGCFALLLSFVARFACRAPIADDYSNFHILFGESLYSPAAYWAQHNEHRIPLPRAVWVAAVRLAGYDFRAPIVLNAVLLGAAVAFLLAVVRRVRGRFAVTDAFIPLTVLSIGSWENLLWGFQVQFILSTVLGLFFLGFVVTPGFPAAVPRLAAAGVITMLLPLCGANGVALVPAFGACLVFLGARNLRSRATRRAGWVALAGGLVGWAMVAAYFHGLQKPTYHPPPPGLGAVAVTGINVLGLGLCPATPWLHPPGHAGVTVTGLVAVALVIAAVALLAQMARDRKRADRAVALGCLLAGFLCLAGGLAYGRAGFGNILGANRYSTLAMPVLVAAYFAAVASRRAGGRVLAAALFAAAVLNCPLNVRLGCRLGEFQAFRVKLAEHDAKSGMPVWFAADRHPGLMPGHPRGRRIYFEILRDRGVVPFDRLSPNPELSEEPVSVRVLRVDGMAGGADGYRVTGERGTIVLALPRRQHVFGLRLVYEAGREAGGLPRSVLSWELEGRELTTPGCGVVNQLDVTDGPTPTLILVNREADVLRIDLFEPGSTLRVHALAVLTRAD